MVEVVSLESAHRSLTQSERKFRRLTETLIGAAPSFIARHSHAGSKRPVDPGGPHFFGRDAGRAFNQTGITRASEADVVREDHCPENIVMSVDCIDTIEQRNCKSSLQGMSLIAVVHVGPGLQAVSRLRIGAAATEERSQEILLNVFYILKCILFRLSHLPDLFIQR